MFTKPRGATKAASIIDVIEHQNRRRKLMGLPLHHEMPANHQLTPGNRKRRQLWVNSGGAAA